MDALRLLKGVRPTARSEMLSVFFHQAKVQLGEILFIIRQKGEHKEDINVDDHAHHVTSLVRSRTDAVWFPQSCA